MWVLPFQLSSSFVSGWYNVWNQGCINVCLFIGFIFELVTRGIQNAEYRGNIKNWRLWSAVEAKQQHCLERKNFIWWVRLHAGVGLEPTGNSVIYSLSVSADRQEVNGFHVSARFGVGWLLIRQSAQVGSQDKHRLGSWFSSHDFSRQQCGWIKSYQKNTTESICAYALSLYAFTIIMVLA